MRLKKQDNEKKELKRKFGTKGKELMCITLYKFKKDNTALSNTKKYMYRKINKKTGSFLYLCLFNNIILCTYLIDFAIFFSTSLLTISVCLSSDAIRSYKITFQNIT